MIKPFDIYYDSLFFLFLSGSVMVIFLSIKRHDPLLLIKIGVIGVFFIHFFLYGLAGTMKIPFGWQRNFFYLLPVYFLVIFYFLRETIKNRVLYYIVSSILLVLSLCLSIEKCYQWQQVNLLREMVRLAGQNQYDSVIISQRSIDRWPFEYYSKKYGIDQKVLRLDTHDNKNDFSKIIETLCSKDNFVVIQPFRADILNRVDREGCLESFRIVNKKKVFVDTGPYDLLIKATGRRPQAVFEYFYSVQMSRLPAQGRRL